jgi:hypothetical protein
MSVSMTLDAVRARQKTVTRRHIDTWKNLKPGDRLTLIEKGMGLPKGSKQVVVCEVEIVDVDVEPVNAIACDPWETEREGLPHMSPVEFCAFWLTGHGYKATDDPAQVMCRRIEWRYLDEAAA